MIIIGHRFIPSFLSQHGNFYHIPNIDAIKNTPPNSCIFIEFSEDNLDIIEHLQKNSISFCLKVEDVTQIIYAANLGASFILVDKDLAKTAQDLANNYLFDAKILVSIDDEENIEELALQGIDGVLFSNAIIKINS
ncbi:MAG: hypothetical protein OQJ77_05085 [Thiovulaceae bacterium]|nr:hypothetical protein [Sulfurimonadaceae bacterium]MCW9026672.1 hypothetical protein [Sulfurimonadaceae bacterium]